MCRAFSSVQKKWKEGLKVLGMYLATAVAKAVQEGNSQVFVTFLIEIPLVFLVENDRSHCTFSSSWLARLGGISSSITSQSGREASRISRLLKIHVVSTTLIFWQK